MFSDAVGSTELSRKLDLEDYGDVMLRYQNLCDEVVDRRGGHMAHYAGDGLLAVFGWPMSHERDADHAVLAALDLFDELPALNDYLEETYAVRLSLRIGIHSGLAVIGKLGRTAATTRPSWEKSQTSPRVCSTRHRSTVLSSAT